LKNKTEKKWSIGDDGSKGLTNVLILLACFLILFGYTGLFGYSTEVERVATSKVRLNAQLMSDIGTLKVKTITNKEHIDALEDAMCYDLMFGRDNVYIECKAFIGAFRESIVKQDLDVNVAELYGLDYNVRMSQETLKKVLDGIPNAAKFDVIYSNTKEGGLNKKTFNLYKELGLKK
jgi:hypothetical protein